MKSIRLSPSLFQSYFAIAFILVLNSSIGFAQNIIINEVMSSNQTTIMDEDGDYPDWIELYNSALYPVRLEGYGITDNPSEPNKWIFPNVTIQSQSFLILFASEKNRRIPEHELHTNFKVSSSGESLILTSPEGTQVCNADIVSLGTDQSYSIIPDGIGEYYICDISTPASSNGNTPPLPATDPPEYSMNGGKYNAPFVLSLHHPSIDAEIYYTLDGSIPGSDSFRFEDPIYIEESTVIRAIAFRDNYSPSNIVSTTYLINVETELPVFSIITEPDNLWDWNTGIYVEGPNAEPDPPHYGANYHQDWMIPAKIEMYGDDPEDLFSSDCQIGIYGGWSRSAPRKSLKVVSTDQPFRHQFFNDLPIYEFKSFLLRNSGNDWRKTLLHDAYLTQLASGYGVLFQDYDPAIVFINGEYWGIHNLREKISADFIAKHYGINPDNIDMIKLWWVVDNGSGEEFLDMMNSLETMDMTIPDNYEYVENLIDIKDFAKYQAFEIFIANYDWPANNTRCWRDRTSGKYRWIIYDTDYSFGSGVDASTNILEFALETNSDLWVNNPRSTRLFRKLIDIEEFKYLFVNNICDLINLFFTQERQQDVLTSLSDEIADEIPEHMEKWGNLVRPWQNSLNELLEFGEDRPQYIFQHISERFGFSDPVRIHLINQDQNQGKIWINGYQLSDPYFTGIYYSEVPINIWVESNTGYCFSGWTGSINTDSDTLVFNPEEGLELFANFEEVDNLLPHVVINEINYNSCPSFECQDWIELTTSMDFVDISYWSIKDSQDDNVFIIPENTVLYRDSHLILARDCDLFRDHYPNCEDVIGDLGFGLNSSGDAVRIYNQNNELIDSVYYYPSLPWPPQANGTGSTLQLIDINSDNSRPHNWIASTQKNGDPGSHNQFIDVKPIETVEPAIPFGYGILKTYPNPFNSTLSLEFRLPASTTLEVSIYNIQGQLVKRISNQRCIKDQLYSLSINNDNLSSGLYFLRGTTDTNDTYIKKITLIK